MKWGAKHEYEYVENYKVLQAAFDRNGIKRHIDVGKLVKCRYLDNLEFCQWLKAYFEKNYNGEEYDALGRRKNAQLHYILGGGKVGAPPQAMPRAGGGSAASSNTGPRQASGAGGASAAAASRPAGSGIGGGARAGAAAATSGAAGAASAAKVRELEATI